MTQQEIISKIFSACISIEQACIDFTLYNYNECIERIRNNIEFQAELLQQLNIKEIAGVCEEWILTEH